jgi:hypothetical protein
MDNKGDNTMNTTTTYTEAQAILKRNKRNKCEHVVTWDAGDGWKGRGYYSIRMNRIITVAISPTGFEVI